MSEAYAEFFEHLKLVESQSYGDADLIHLIDKIVGEGVNRIHIMHMLELAHLNGMCEVYNAVENDCDYRWAGMDARRRKVAKIYREGP